jgi:hypothetical protein
MPGKVSDKAVIGRLGGLSTSSRYDSKLITANARAAFLDRFETEVDPDGTLPREERERRAAAARRAHFVRLARRSAAVRREKRPDLRREGA